MEAQLARERRLEVAPAKVSDAEGGGELHRRVAVAPVEAVHRVPHRLARDVDADVVLDAADLELVQVAALAAGQVQNAVPPLHVLADEHRLDPVIEVAQVQDVAAAAQRAVPIC